MLIAQLSDIHARPDGVRLATLARALDWLATLRPDAIVFSGDLVDDGWDEGYGHIAALAADQPCPVWAVPGNVDDRELMRARLAAMPATGPLHFTGDVGDLRIIGLDVTVDGASHGDLAPHLDWIAGHLPPPGAPLLLVMHQPPIGCGIAALDPCRCRSSGRLLETLAAASVQPLAILCGHFHRSFSGMLGPVPVRGSGSIRPPNPLPLDGRDPPLTDGPSLLIHHVTGAGLVTHTVAVPAA